MNIHRLYRPFLRHFRTKRMQRLCRLFGLTETTRVLDVGGDFFNWSLVSTVPSLTNCQPVLTAREREQLRLGYC